ncbi:Na/Pi cotransporter family protein [Psychrobacter sp. H8-1]|uniref:Na/Pi cotransporter family protein n=1 Tax=Psychrobacter sp. H8-1 TaxID=2774129 RepID=UPI00191A7B37|nr:Na/Pi cotransporter family protein [Psychrobacter sp. H8-1]
MYRRIILLTVFLVLSYGFWISPNLKQISAGVAIFLFGMLALEEGFRAFTGGLLEKILKKTTTGLWKSMSFGVVTTTLMQSSSLVSVITISFLSAGLISLASGIGIIFGANLGTTTGAWLVAGFGLKVDIAAYAMPMLVFGVILILQKSKHLKGVGYILAGLGFLFLGIHYMKEGFELFRENIDLTAYAMTGLKGLLLYTLIGIAATVIMQSSHATLVLIITALASQQITYDNALALAIGSNIGTTITAIIGAISAGVNGKRLAAAHLVFNVITGLVAIALISQLMLSVDWLSERLKIAADNYTLKLAVFHTLFNLLGVILMVPFIGRLGDAITKLLPDKAYAVAEPMYLKDSALDIPELAVEAVHKEILNLGDYFFGIICHGLSFRVKDIRSNTPIQEVIDSFEKPIPVNLDEEYTNKIKGLYVEIVNYIGRINNENMSAAQSNEIFELRSAGRSMLAAIKSTKHLHKNLSRYLSDPNPYVRAEYNKIRYRLGTILRSLAEIQEDPDELRTVLPTIEAMRVDIMQADQRFVSDMNQLIRERKITGAMATSLMNDNNYTNNIANQLLEIATILFKSADADMHEVEQSLMLDEQETADAIAARKIKEQESVTHESQ